MFGQASRLDRPVEGLCISYAPGSIALSGGGKPNRSLLRRSRGPYPRNVKDPMAWHEFEHCAGPSTSRIRYTDVWVADGDIAVQAGFQDSCATPSADDARGIYHEYALTARVSDPDFVLQDITIAPGSLPFPTCPQSRDNIGVLKGRPIADFGKTVSAELGGTAGCTHLNETLKSLQDVPALVRALLETQEQS